MWLIILYIVIITLCLLKLNRGYNLLALCPRLKTIDGRGLEEKINIVPGVTIFGNNFDLCKFDNASVFQFFRQQNLLNQGKSYVLELVSAPVLNINNAEDAEELLMNSSSLLTKSHLYALLEPFLGEGLLISTNDKWRMRRKILTPAFHLSVLQSFHEIFKEESLKLINKLESLHSNPIDLSDVMSQFTLNNVCETALGVKLDNINGSTEYRQVIHEIEVIICQRTCSLIQFIPIIFYLIGPYKHHKKCLKIAHDFSSRIIVTKRREYLSKGVETMEMGVKKNDDLGQKKRYALLDTLLGEESKGNIDHQGICDEVNTFMFEGYDTTFTALTFALLNLAWHPEVQNKCRKEIRSKGDFSSLSIFDFNELVYLECVLKESLRLYPSVPLMGRRCTHQTQLNGLILPKRTQIILHTIDIMRDEKHFPEPLAFKPDRFLPENSVKRHPCAYLPFSIGSRNCIGQKFAMLEMKAALVAILSKFQILPITKPEDLTFENGINLRTTQKVYVKLEKLMK